MQLTLSQLTRYFLRLGTVGFGGPIALCAQMKNELVDKLHWFTPEEYEEGFAFSQAAPGPIAYQLALYLGFIRFGIRGATLSGVAFIATPFVLVLLLSVLYVNYGSVTWIQSILYAVSPAVVAIVMHATVQLGRSMLRLWNTVLIAVSAFTLAVVLNVDLSLIILGAGIAGLLSAGHPWRSAAGAVPTSLLLMVQEAAQSSFHHSLPLSLKLMWFFFKAGALTFGSGYVVIAFIQNGVVDEYHWLTARQFLDAVAVGQMTPGPVVITATFVGYLVDGFQGAFLSTMSVLLPVYLITILGAPLVAKYRRSPLLQGFISYANAAAIGVVASVALRMTQSAVMDWKTAGIMIISLILLFLRDVPSVIIVAAAAGVGVLLLLV